MSRVTKDKKVVSVAILGSGFGAIHTALQLRKERQRLPKNITLEIDIISRTGYFWLVTMAHEIATGNLLPDDVVQSLRSLPVSIYDNYIQAEIKGVDSTTNQVTAELLDVVDDKLETTFVKQYDYVVSSLGSNTFYFGVKGANKYALPLKTLDNVRRIKNNILQSFEDAELIPDIAEVKTLLHFVIVGGGPTGVEVAAELADMINGPLTKRFPKVVQHARITIVHGGEKLGIPGYDWMAIQLAKVLDQKGRIEVMCNSFVTEVTTDGVMVGDTFIASKNVIWTGGVMASQVPLTTDSSAVRTKQGRVEVARDLSLTNSFFVIGDQASAKDKSGNEYPMRAQFAVRQGKVVAKNIINDLVGLPREEFDYQDKGVILSLGQGKAVARVYDKKLKGLLAYWVYKIVYIPQIIGLRARVKTVVSWILNIFTPRDLSKL